MKTDRSSVTRAATVLLLTFLLLGVGLPAAGVKVTVKVQTDHQAKPAEEVETGRVRLAEGVETGNHQTGEWLAMAIVKQVKQIHERFTMNRNTLRILSEPGNAPGYLSDDVTRLIVDTHKDLDQTIQNIRPSGTEPLRAWVDDEFQQIQEKIPPPGPTATLPGLSAPRTSVVLASLRAGAPRVLAKTTSLKPTPTPPQATQPPKPQTIPTATANQLLDQVEEVVSRIFTLADHNDLEVNLWVGSASARKARFSFWPVSHALFSFWPKGQIKSSPLISATIQLDGKKNHVLRGLYIYRAAWTQGKVTQIIEYPQSAGTQTTPTERLDLVNGTGFFCCRFSEQYCYAVASEKECRS
jgi:hypothetical protein